MTVERSAADAAQALATALSAAGIPYAIGGALALAVAGVPRGTADVDINVFVDEQRLPDVLRVLAGVGVEVDALSVFKLLFFRGKDMVDLERLVAVRPELDVAYVRRWIVDMMGESDDRTRRWDEIVQRFGRPTPHAGS